MAPSLRLTFVPSDLYNRGPRQRDRPEFMHAASCFHAQANPAGALGSQDFVVMFYLMANNGPQTGKRYELKGEKWILGRHPDCQIVIEVGAVSRNHCQIVRDGSLYFIEDLGSRNGTFINDEPEKMAGRRQLKPGDMVRVCEVTFTFKTDEVTPNPPAT